MEQIIKTLYVVFFYFIIWWILEIVFYGGIEDRIVDIIMMTVFIPTIYKSCEEHKGE